MSKRYHVFISFGGDETYPFANDLRRKLEAAGFSIWLDQRQIKLGDAIRSKVLQGLTQSTVAILLVNARWLHSQYAAEEFATFCRLAQEDPRRKVFPLLLDDDVEADLRERLRPLGVKYQPWPPREIDNPDLFERLTEQLHQSCPGVARRSSSVLPPASREAGRSSRSRQETRWGPEVRCLTLDRRSHWGGFDAFLRARHHGRLFVLGPNPEAHERFLDRIRAFCPTSNPAARIREVRWRYGIPETRGGFVSALAMALECESTDEGVEGALRRFLVAEDLILIHRPVLSADELTLSLERYHKLWLPALLPAVSGGYMRAVQAFDWRVRSLRTSRSISRPPREFKAFLQDSRPAQWMARDLFLTPSVEISDLREWFDVNQPAMALPDRRRAAERIFHRTSSSEEVFLELIEWAELQEGEP